MYCEVLVVLDDFEVGDEGVVLDFVDERFRISASLIDFFNKKKIH
jgi:hypothetical protein